MGRRFFFAFEVAGSYDPRKRRPRPKPYRGKAVAPAAIPKRLGRRESGSTAPARIRKGALLPCARNSNVSGELPRRGIDREFVELSR